MQIEIGKNLSWKLRTLADKVQNRMWIAVPYVGGWGAVTSVLGLRWRDDDEVTFRLLTDTDNKGWLDKQTIEAMNSHGQIKHLQGLHAKVYIIDDRAFVTSANLTDMAFSRRYEVGIFLSPKESKTAIKHYAQWWDNKAQFPPRGWIKTLTKSNPNKGKKEEPSKSRPAKLFSLPVAPSDGEWSSPLFRDYKSFQTSYREFALSYESIGKRLFPKAPLFIETDMFLNYLFHHDSQPSKKYAKTKPPRNLTKNQQKAEISKYAKRFRDMVGKDQAEMDVLKDRATTSSEIGRLLDAKRIDKIGWSEVQTVVSSLHCMSAYDINKKKMLNPKNNSLQTVRDKWKFLLYRTDLPIELRMTKCYEGLFGFGQSAVQELLGWFDPKKYPIRNSNSSAGLRFLGY